MIILSLASAGVVADYIAENDLLTAPNQSIALFGSHVTVSGVAVVIGGPDEWAGHGGRLETRR